MIFKRFIIFSKKSDFMFSYFFSQFLCGYKKNSEIFIFLFFICCQPTRNPIMTKNETKIAVIRSHFRLNGFYHIFFCLISSIQNYFCFSSKVIVHTLLGFVLYFHLILQLNFSSFCFQLKTQRLIVLSKSTEIK